MDPRAEAAALSVMANGSTQHHEGNQPPDRLLAIPTDSHQFGRVAPWRRLALGNRRSDPDATALHLEVGKRFCGLLALDDEDSAIPRTKSWTPATGSPKPARGSRQPLAAQTEASGVRPGPTPQPRRGGFLRATQRAD